MKNICDWKIVIKLVLLTPVEKDNSKNIECMLRAHKRIQ